MKTMWLLLGVLLFVLALALCLTIVGIIPGFVVAVLAFLCLRQWRKARGASVTPLSRVLD